MGELRRIVCQKKYLLAVFVLLIANLFLFQYYQMDNLQALRDKETRQDTLDVWQEDQETAKEEFVSKIKEMDAQSETLSEISIFSDENSFVNQNIQRTKKDFARIKGVNIDVSHSEKAMSEFLKYDEIFYVFLLFIIVTVLNFFDERKSGLWQITYSCKAGRMKLAVKRLGIFLFLTLLFSFFIFSETLWMAFFDYGGSGILSSPAQSVIALKDFTLPLSVSGFLIYYWVICTLLMMFTGLFVWAFLSLVHNRNLGLVLVVLIYGTAFALYHLIPQQHPLCVLRYFNLWFFASPKETFLEYVNFRIGGVLVNLREFVQGTAIVFCAAAGIAACYINKRTRPFYAAGIVERILERVNEWWKKILCHCHGIGFELYKTLFYGKGIFAAIIFAYLIVSGISMEDLMVSPAREQLNHFYEQNTGYITKETMQPYEKITKELKKIEENRAKASGKSLKEADDIYESYEATRAMALKLEERLNYAEKLEKQGIDGWWLNETGYRWLFGKGNVSDRMVHGALAILAMIFMLSGCYAMERQSGVRFILRCTKKGRKSFFLRKEVCAVITAVFTCGLTVGAEIYEAGRLYNLDGLSAPVQNISFLQNVPFSISIGQFLCIWIFMRFLIYMMVANLCLMISSTTERVEKAQMISLSLLIFTVISGVSEYTVLGTQRGRKTIFIGIFVLLCLCISIFVTYRRWRNVND